jgi:hypothetical protein
MFLNGLIAVIAILAGLIAGWNAPAFATMQPIGLIVGGLGGLVVSAVVCGILAFFGLIEDHLRTLADAADRQP